jgi:hypothetical protein
MRPAETGKTRQRRDRREDLRQRNRDGEIARAAAEPQARAAERDGEERAQNHRKRSHAHVVQRPRHLEGALVECRTAYQGKDRDQKVRRKQAANAEHREHQRDRRQSAGEKPRQRSDVFTEAFCLVNAEKGEAHPLGAEAIDDQRPGEDQNVMTVLFRTCEAGENSDGEEIARRRKSARAEIR